MMSLVVFINFLDYLYGLLTNENNINYTNLLVFRVGLFDERHQIIEIVTDLQGDFVLAVPPMPYVGDISGHFPRIVQFALAHIQS